MARIALSDLTPWITEAVLAHPQDLPAHLCQRLNISRTSARAPKYGSDRYGSFMQKRSSAPGFPPGAGAVAMMRLVTRSGRRAA